jgi:hypothetical protein
MKDSNGEMASMIAYVIQYIKYLFISSHYPFSIAVKVKYAGTQQQPSDITIEVAFEIKVTISMKTSKAITIALGFTFAVF